MLLNVSVGNSRNALHASALYRYKRVLEIASDMTERATRVCGALRAPLIHTTRFTRLEIASDMTRSGKHEKPATARERENS